MGQTVRPKGQRETSERGKNLIRSYEKCRLKRYVDDVGVPTIGWGHKILPDEDWTVLTQEEADWLFECDVLLHEAVVNKHVKVPLNQNQFDALSSFAYNYGEMKFLGSTLLRKLNAGDFEGAANEFPKWKYGRDKKTKNMIVMRGLVRRRAEERELFLEPPELTT